MNAVNQGCRQTLVHLDLSRNPFKRSSRDSANVSSSWQQFFSSAFAIQSVNLSSTKIHPEAVRLDLTIHWTYLFSYIALQYTNTKCLPLFQNNLSAVLLVQILNPYKNGGTVVVPRGGEW